MIRVEQTISKVKSLSLQVLFIYNLCKIYEIQQNSYGLLFSENYGKGHYLH